MGIIKRKNYMEKIKKSNIQRKIRIWISSNFPNTTANVVSGNNKSDFSLTNKEHNSIVVNLNEKNPTIQIKSTDGPISIGGIEINYSWKVNPFFEKKFQKDTEIFLRENFDLYNVSKPFIDNLENFDFLISTGDSGFSATRNLKYNVKINGKLDEDNKKWYELQANDIFECDILLTEPSIIDENTIVKIPIDGWDDSMLNPTLCQKYSQSFFDNMDTRFFEFVEKKVHNQKYCWNNDKFSGYALHQSQKIRTQAQLLDNKHLIKNKKILDLGTYMGGFLYPCLELGCESIIGAQYLKKYNSAINEALESLNLQDKSFSTFCDFYDFSTIVPLIKNVDTILALGIIYHINHHYEFLKLLSNGSASAIIIDTVILDKHYFFKNEPMMTWINEYQSIDSNAKETQSPNKLLSWVGIPNAAWIIQTMLNFGWELESNKMVSTFALSQPQLKSRGVFTFVR